MSKRNKLQKFAELLTFPNVLENFDPRQPQLIGEGALPLERKGQWAKGQFLNEHPITIELACGRGEYSLQLARQYPNRNFIGLDIKGARIWKGATIALEEDLKNVAFLRTRIEQVPLFFAPSEVDEIWITFPDPFLRQSKKARRLTSPVFLERYRQILRPGGLVHLKTDSPELFEFSQNVFEKDPRVEVLYQKEDIYKDDLQYPELEFKTYYEKMHLKEGKSIKYIRFTIH